MRLGRRLHRKDWWNLKREHTPYEWALQIAAEIVEPDTERRADIRTALATIAIIGRSGFSSITKPELESLYQSLANYLKRDSAEEKPLTPDEVTEVMNRAKRRQSGR